MFLVKVSGQSLAAMDTCACNTLTKLKTLYQSVKNKPEYAYDGEEFDAFVKDSLKLNIKKPSTNLIICEYVKKMGLEFNANDQEINSEKVKYWSDYTAAVLSIYTGDSNTFVSPKLVCNNNTVTFNEYSDPFNIQLFVLFLLNQKNTNPYLKINSKNFNEYLFKLLLKTLREEQNQQNLSKNYLSLKAVFNATFNQANLPVSRFLKQTILADVTYIPDCLREVDSTKISYLIKVQTKTQFMDFLSTYFSLFKQKDTIAIAKMDSTFHTLKDLCNGGYRLPSSQYLFSLKHLLEKELFQSTKIKIETVPTADSIIARETVLLLGTLNHKPQPDLLLTKSIFVQTFRSQNSYFMHELNNKTTFLKSPLWFGTGGKSADLIKLETVGNESNQFNFHQSLNMMLTSEHKDTIGIKLNLPSENKLWMWHRIYKFADYQVIGRNENVLYIASKVLISVPEQYNKRVSLNPNFSFHFTGFNVAKMDTLILLIEVIHPKTNKEQQKSNTPKPAKLEYYFIHSEN